MDADIKRLPPGDPKIVKSVMNHLKSQGIFDQFRRDCIADADTKPAYQNLRHRVEGFANDFLQNTPWRPELNKNQQREMLRRKINDSGMLTTGVDRIIDQIVNQKICQVFMPKITEIVHKFLGIEKSQTDEAKDETYNEHELTIASDMEVSQDSSSEENSRTSSTVLSNERGATAAAVTAEDDTSSDGELPAATTNWPGQQYPQPAMPRTPEETGSRPPLPSESVETVTTATAGVEDDDASTDIMLRISRVLQEYTALDKAVAAKGLGNFASVGQDIPTAKALPTTDSPNTSSRDVDEQNSNKSVSSFSSVSSAREQTADHSKSLAGRSRTAESAPPIPNKTPVETSAAKSPLAKTFKFEPQVTRSSSGSCSPKISIKLETHSSSCSSSPRRPSKVDRHPHRSPGSVSPKLASRKHEHHTGRSSNSPKFKQDGHSRRSPGTSSSPRRNTRHDPSRSSESSSPKSRSHLKTDHKRETSRVSKSPSQPKEDRSKSSASHVSDRKVKGMTPDTTCSDSSSSNSSSTATSGISESSSSRSSARLRESGSQLPARYRDQITVSSRDDRGGKTADGKTTRAIREGSGGDSSKSDEKWNKHSSGRNSDKSSRSESRGQSDSGSKRPPLPTTSSTSSKASSDGSSRNSRDTSKPLSGRSDSHSEKGAGTSGSKSMATSKDRGSKDTRKTISEMPTFSKTNVVSPRRSSPSLDESTTARKEVRESVGKKRGHPTDDRDGPPSKQHRDVDRNSPRPPPYSPLLGPSSSPRPSESGGDGDTSAGTPSSSRRQSDKSPHRRSVRRKLSESPAKSQPFGATEEDDEGEMSDVTVSSVHTSDLSDFDDRIVLSDNEGGDEDDTKPSRSAAVTIKIEREDERIEGDARDFTAVVKREPDERTEPSGDPTSGPTVVAAVEKPCPPDVKPPPPPPHLPPPPLPPPPPAEADEPRRGSQRQRKVNPRYTSDDFSSIFNSGASSSTTTRDHRSTLPLPPPPASSSDVTCGGSAEGTASLIVTAPVVTTVGRHIREEGTLAPPAPDTAAPVRGRRLTGLSSTTDEFDLAPGSPTSDASELSLETASRVGRRTSARNKLWSPVESSDGEQSSARGRHTPDSVTPDAQEGQFEFRPRTSSQHSGGSGKRRDRSRSSGGDSSLVSPVDESAHCSSKTDTDSPHTLRRSSRNDSQRYDNADLYKPRPTYASSRRRALSPGKSQSRYPTAGAGRHLDDYPPGAAELSRWARKPASLSSQASGQTAARGRSSRSSTEIANQASTSKGPGANEFNLLRPLRRRSIKLVY